MSIYNSSSNSLEERKTHFIERLNEKYPNFEYVSGYVNSECDVLLRCKKCGELQTKKSSCVRSSKKLTCFNCMKLETIDKNNRRKEIKRMVEQQRLYMIKAKSNKKKEIHRIYINLKNNTLYIKRCNHCNKEYIEHTTSNYCANCRKRIRDKHSNKSLQKLYKRDKGICYICGNKCDYEDYIYRGNTFIAGNYYPSIDHYIPLAKGGTDDWNNLGLAHRICNTRKREKILD